MFKIIALLAVISAAYVNNVEAVDGVTLCGGSGTFLALRIPGCSSQPCNLIGGRTYAVEFDFVPHVSGAHVRLTVSAVVFGIPIEIIDATLPHRVDAGQGYTLEYDLVTDVQLVGMTVPIRAQLFAASGQLEVCGEFTVSVTAP